MEISLRRRRLLVQEVRNIHAQWNTPYFNVRAATNDLYEKLLNLPEHEQRLIARRMSANLRRYMVCYNHQSGLAVFITLWVVGILMTLAAEMITQMQFALWGGLVSLALAGMGTWWSTRASSKLKAILRQPQQP